MHPLFIPNLKRSIEGYVSCTSTVPSELIVQRGDTEIAPTNLSARSARPWFYLSEDNRLNSLQAPFFGIYAVPQMIRSPLLATRYIEAGDLLVDGRYYSMAVAAYYTAALHLLGGFLSSYGRVLLEPVNGRPYYQKMGTAFGTGYERLDSIEQVIGILTNRNSWIFERRVRSHPGRWRELRAVFAEHPDALDTQFRELFSYMTSYGPIRTNQAEFDLEESLERLVSCRHDALYRGFGYDDFVFDALVNRDGFFTGLDLRARHFRSFAISILNYLMRCMAEVRNAVAIDELQKIASPLIANVWMPPFEEMSRDSSNVPSDLRSVHELQNWFQTISLGNQ